MKKENFTMKELPDSEKPYEKCERDGAKSLSNAECTSFFSGFDGIVSSDAQSASSDSRNWSGEGSSDFVCGGVVQTTGKRE